ncbi:hypothetical protein J2X82_005667 [Priestia megaterium]|jgi:hypothetical protein|nr:hypothetical protein [Priestia megaterium]
MGSVAFLVLVNKKYFGLFSTTGTMLIIYIVSTTTAMIINPLVSTKHRLIPLVKYIPL